MVGSDAGSVHSNPRAHEEHGCTGGADNVGEDRASCEEERVAGGSGPAAHADVDAAGDEIQGAY